MQQEPPEQHAHEADAHPVPGEGTAVGSGVKRDLDLTPEESTELFELAAKGSDPTSEGYQELTQQLHDKIAAMRSDKRQRL
eukprot:3012670-Pyramimonas_sp.AAC.1